jgi:putative membrane protein
VKRRAPALLLLIVLSSVRLHAHALKPSSAGDLWTAWTIEPGVVFTIAVLGIWYALGIAEFREAGLWGRAFKRWQAWSFAAGLISLVIALMSPLDALGSVLFSAHMTQHEVLMLAAAPLLVLGRPIPVFLKALPRNWRVRLLRIGRWSILRPITHFLGNALVAWFLHGIILWVWHLPFLFNATIDHDWVHALQHICFLGSALVFWWAVFDGHSKKMGYGVAVLYIFSTAVHSGVLGAMLSFARNPWYSVYAHSTHAWGLAPVEDQQLGGLIMWIPASAVYIAAGLIVFAGWLRESDLRASRHSLLPTGKIA